MTDRMAGEYECLMIDPPWPQHVQVHAFQGNRDPRRKIPYRKMTLNELMAFDIRRWAAEQCHVFTFATQVSIQWVFEILRKWGVRYRFTIPWDKHRGVNTQRLRRRFEFLVYGTIGKYRPPLATLPAVLDVPAKGKNSEKPQEIYDIIAAATPAPRMDLFARQSRPNFDSWGLEAPGGCAA